MNGTKDQQAFKQLPGIADIHTRALYLRGMAVALNDIDPMTPRERDAAAGIAYAAEMLAGQVANDLEKLWEREVEA
ncbi:MAG: hypothetical protein RID23_16290 [Roseovarius sp.]